MIKNIKTTKEFFESPIFSQWLQTHKKEELHPCFQCPEIKEDFDWRISTENDLCAYERTEDFLDDIREICDNCWCAKYGGKTWMVRYADHCNQANNDNSNSQTGGNNNDSKNTE